MARQGISKTLSLALCLFSPKKQIRIQFSCRMSSCKTFVGNLTDQSDTWPPREKDTYEKMRPSRKRKQGQYFIFIFVAFKIYQMLQLKKSFQQRRQSNNLKLSVIELRQSRFKILFLFQTPLPPPALLFQQDGPLRRRARSLPDPIPSHVQPVGLPGRLRGRPPGPGPLPTGAGDVRRSVHAVEGLCEGLPMEVGEGKGMFQEMWYYICILIVTVTEKIRFEWHGILVLIHLVLMQACQVSQKQLLQF